MPKLCYIPKRFRGSSLLVIKRANTLLEAYAAAGMQITLRTLYYRFVAKGWMPNHLRSYKRLGKIIGEARLAGRIDWTHMEDRMRNLEVLQHFDGPQQALDRLVRWYHVDLWEGQEYRPEVWIEKDALSGVIGPVCNEYDVPYFCCRGYTSLSEMWRASLRLDHWSRGGQKPFIIHFGDHDPSGIDMSRDILARTTETFNADCEFRRVAINMDQIKQYNPPPNPAKVKDSRYKSYVREFGTNSWEVDALEPEKFQELVRENIESILDRGKFEACKIEKERVREQLTEVAAKWEEVGPSLQKAAALEKEVGELKDKVSKLQAKARANHGKPKRGK